MNQTATYGRLIGWHRCPACGHNHPRTPETQQTEEDDE